MRKKIIGIISDYEAGRTTYDDASRNIASITGKILEKNHLDSYWRSMSLDEFADELALPPIDDWKDITDQRALLLIQEALQNIDGPLFVRNAEALERRYRKEGGFMIQLVFHDAVEHPNEILNELKKDTVIRL